MDESRIVNVKLVLDIDKNAPRAFQQFARAVNTEEKIAGYAYDKYSTNAQIGRQAVRDFVPGGARAQQFVDAMSGRAAEMEEADIQGQRNSARAQQRNEQAGFQLGFNPRAAG